MKQQLLILSIFGVISATVGQQIQVHLHQPQQPLPLQLQQQQQQQPGIEQITYGQPEQRYEVHTAQESNVIYSQPEVVETAATGHEEIAAESFAGAGAWQEASSVGSSALSSGWNTVSEMFVNLGAFQLLLIPAILLTGVFMLYVAYTSPYNAQSHYLVDSIPGYGGYGGHGGFYGPNKWRRSMNSFLGKKIEELTPKVMEAIKSFAAKH